MSWHAVLQFAAMASALSSAFYILGYWRGIASCKRIVAEEYERAKRECNEHIDEGLAAIRQDMNRRVQLLRSVPPPSRLPQ